jgi:hypothetical protein
VLGGVLPGGLDQGSSYSTAPEALEHLGVDLRQQAGNEDWWSGGGSDLVTSSVMPATVPSASATSTTMPVPPGPLSSSSK